MAELHTQEIMECHSHASSDGDQVERHHMERTVWGRLYCHKIKNIQSLDLDHDKFSAGRARENNLTLTINELEESILLIISKVHFSIKRENCGSPVYIEDLSKNGTFVNNEKIGLNKRRILKNDDFISLSQSTHNGFVFKDLFSNDSMNLPEEISSTYHIGRIIGSGGFGVVHLAYNTRTCQQFALKIVEKKDDPERQLNEARIMKILTHPCVVRMYDFVDQPDAFYMTLEYVPGGDLYDRIKKKVLLSEDITKLYFYQICQAVKYLHDRGIIHLDVKLENVLLATNDDETLAKLCDFGLSRFVQKDTRPGRQCYSRKADIWSLGCVAFCCLSGRLPFLNENSSKLREMVMTREFDFLLPSWESVSQGAKDLINQIFTVDSKKRPSIDHVLQSSWLHDQQMLQKVRTIMLMRSKTEVKNCVLDELPVTRSRFYTV